MAMPLESIEAEALQLTPDDRALLVERLVASISPPFAFEEEWEAEITRRLVAIESGEAELIPLETALADARRAVDPATGPGDPEGRFRRPCFPETPLRTALPHP